MPFLCRDERRAYIKRYYREHLTEIRAYKKQYYKEHSEKIKVHQRQYCKKHRERMKENARQWREKHLEEVRAYKQQWGKDNPEKVNAYSHRRRAIRAGAAIGTITPGGIAARFSMFGGCCYCGENHQPMTIDHRIPLSRGGPHCLSNIVPACTHCNCSKQTKTETEFKVLMGALYERK